MVPVTSGLRLYPDSAFGISFSSLRLMSRLILVTSIVLEAVWRRVLSRPPFFLLLRSAGAPGFHARPHQGGGGDVRAKFFGTALMSVMVTSLIFVRAGGLVAHM